MGADFNFLNELTSDFMKYIELKEYINGFKTFKKDEKLKKQFNDLEKGLLEIEDRLKQKGFYFINVDIPENFYVTTPPSVNKESLNKYHERKYEEEYDFFRSIVFIYNLKRMIYYDRIKDNNFLELIKEFIKVADSKINEKELKEKWAFDVSMETIIEISKELTEKLENDLDTSIKRDNERFGLLLGSIEFKDGNLKVEIKNVLVYEELIKELKKPGEIRTTKFFVGFNEGPEAFKDEVTKNIVGSYHTHPNGDVRPSSNDLVNVAAYWRGYFELILGRNNGFRINLIPNYENTKVFETNKLFRKELFSNKS